MTGSAAGPGQCAGEFRGRCEFDPDRAGVDRVLQRMQVAQFGVAGHAAQHRPEYPRDFHPEAFPMPAVGDQSLTRKVVQGGPDPQL